MKKNIGRILMVSSILMFSNDIFSFSFHKTKKVEAAELEGAKAVEQIEMRCSPEDVKLLMPVRNDRSLVINFEASKPEKFPV